MGGAMGAGMNTGYGQMNGGMGMDASMGGGYGQANVNAGYGG